MREPTEAELPGKHAKTPPAIPRRGLLQALKRAYYDLSDDNVSIVAGGVAFYSMLSVFPLLIAMISIYGLIANPMTVEDQFNAMARIMPDNAATVIRDQLHSLVTNPGSTLSWSLVVSIAAAIWAGTRGTKAMINGLNIAYDEPEKRGFFKLNTIAIAMTMAGLLIGIAAVLLIAGLPVLMNFIGLSETQELVIEITRWLFVAVLLTGALACVNRYGPSRAAPKWRWVSYGAAITILAILAVSYGFSWYVSQFGSYDKTYGSLAGVVVLMLWIYFSCYLILVGAEINAEIEHQTAEDSTTGTAQPMGERGAVKADTYPRRAGKGG